MKRGGYRASGHLRIEIVLGGMIGFAALVFILFAALYSTGLLFSRPEIVLAAVVVLMVGGMMCLFLVLLSPMGGRRG